MALTDRDILGLKPKPKQYYVIDRQRERGKGALWLLIRPTGHKEFYFVYTQNKKRFSISIGSYSKSNAGQGITLEQARAKKNKLAAFLIQGLNPKSELARLDFERTQEERKQNQLGTVKQLFEGYSSNMEASGKKSFREALRGLTVDALPILGKDTPANQITSYQIKLVLHKVIKRGALVASNRLRSYLSASFTYGIEHDNDPSTMDSLITFQLERNPVRDVPKTLKNEKPADRELSPDEIKQLWNHFNPTQQFSHIEHTLKLVLATGGQRIMEVSQAKWGEFDLNKAIWEIPGERTKNGKTHLVPLNNLSLDLLDNVQAHNDGSPYLFPHKLNKDKHILLASISRATNRYTGNADNKFEHFNPRDLRRTCKTRMGELGLSKEIRDRINNHALNDVSSKHYDRYDYMTEKRTALNAWGKYLKQIIDGTNLSNVIAINTL
jgi:integrase